MKMYDIIIIGAGTAGISAYKEAIKHTQNILIINDGPWDTTCARVGCMPSKVLISTANRAHEINTANAVGLVLNPILDTSNVMQHVRKLRDRFTAATLKDVNRWNPAHKISGQAQFINAQTIEVNGQHYQSKSFIIAVGSTPSINEEWKKSIADRLISSDQIFELEKLPQSIAVIGSGVIAIELAQAMHRLGVKTDIFARSRKVGSLSSPQLQHLAQEVLTEELNIHFQVLPEKLERTTEGVRLEYTQNGQPQHLDVDYVLLATGRRSSLHTLKLAAIDTAFESLQDLPVDSKTKQLKDLPIFIIGDAHTTTPLQHEAAVEGRGAVENCLNFPKLKNLKTLTPLGIVFSSPEMASVGKNFKQLSQENVEFVTGTVDYARQGRAIVLGKNQGAAEIYVDKKTRKILGAELFIHSAEHLAHLLAWVIDENLTLDEALNKPFYHPTLEEGLRTALKHARRQLN
jgi:dihydrolipoamide dehydrogenase